MRIAINAMQVRAAKSGVGQYIHALTEAMLPQAPDVEFTVYCTRENIANYTFNAPNVKPRVWGLPEKTRTLRLAYETALLPFELARRKYDVFHGPSNFLPPRKVCPYVVTIHDLSYYVQPERCPPLRRRYWYEMTSRTVKLADIIVADSENTRRDIARFFPGAEQKTRVVHLAAHPRFQQLSIAQAKTQLARLQPELLTYPYVLYVGTLEPGKNVERIIAAFDAVAADFPDHQLLLAGDKGWLYDTIFFAAQRARHADRIHFLGHVSDNVVVELLNFCDVFVFPSLYEGFGLPPLEAMACGAPVITSNTSSVPEVVGDAALTVTPTSTAEITDALRIVLGDEDLRDRLSAAGLQQAQRFSWQTSARQMLDIYHELGRS
jgi:glycosyltransferase involved in cell wall biosynthesis